MQNIINYILAAIGLIIIIKGSDIFVESAVWIARRFGISDIIIGATLVSLCTTLPELVISSTSAIKGSTEMAFGNACGSIAFNTAVILAIIFILARPKLADPGSFRQSAVLLFAAVLVLIAVVIAFGGISKTVGILLLVGMVLYLLNNVRNASKRRAEEDCTSGKGIRGSVTKHAFLLLLGAALIVFASNLIVTNAKEIALALGISEVIIGLTLTAVGSSLPELVTAFSAISKKVYSISMGNILGASIMNVLLVIGASAVFEPIYIDRASALFNLFSIAVISGLTMLFAVLYKNRFRRTDGVVLVAVYAVYLAISFKYFS